MKITPIACILSTLALAACNTTADGLTFQQMYEAGQDINDKIFESGNDNPPPTKEVSGDLIATYAGYSTFSFALEEEGAEEEHLMSKIDMTANFGAKTIEGRMSNFRTEDNIAINGTLNIDGTITDNDVEGYYFDGNLAGLLTFAQSTLDVNGQIGGGMYGNNAAFISGGHSGTASSSNSDSDLYNFYGDFRSEKN